MRQILVIGAGVVGLSSAIVTQESCRDVTVTLMADKFSPNTTSDGSAGICLPSAMGNTDTQLLYELTKETYEYMRGLATSPVASITGAQQVAGYQLFEERMEADPYYKDIMDGYRRLTPEDLSKLVPHSKFMDGVFFMTVTLDVTRYMKWITDRFLSNGGRIVQRKVNSLQELSSEWDVVVNCTGFGARELLQDTLLYPVRGQIIRVRAPWMKHFLIYLSDPGIYAIPNTDNVVVGGTYQVDNWNPEIDKKDSKDIWDRAVKVMPCLQNAEIVTEWVGMRPSRECLRLETEEVLMGDDGRKMRVVHNYGHGGGGVSIHWSCANRAAGMVSQILKELDTVDQNHGRKMSNPSKL